MIGRKKSAGPQPPETRGFEGKASSAGRFLQFFYKNNAFLCIFRPK